LRSRVNLAREALLNVCLINDQTENKIPKVNRNPELSKDMMTSISNNFREDGRFIIYV